MALQRLLRREPVKAAVPAPEPEPEEEGFPAWSVSSLAEWMSPFWAGNGAAWDGPRRNFVREVERNLRLQLDWRLGERGAAESLVAAMSRDPKMQVRVFDFALRNITIGYMTMECTEAARKLDAILRESGAAWCVREDDYFTFHLERRIDATAAAALASLGSEGTPDARHLAEARRWAFGQNPEISTTLSKVSRSMKRALTHWLTTRT